MTRVKFSCFMVLWVSPRDEGRNVQVAAWTAKSVWAPVLMRLQ